MAKNLIKVIFLPSGKTGYFNIGTSILEAAQELEIELPSLCGGVGVCGKCLVKVDEGASPPSDIELEILNNSQIKSGKRLACEVKIEGPITITVLNISSSDKITILESSKRGRIQIDPIVKKRFIVIPKPTLDTNVFDFEQLLDIIGMDSLSCRIPLKLMQQLPNLLRKNDYKGTLVTANQWMLAFEPADTSRQKYGVAVDIGTTTVVGKLIDLYDGRILGVCSHLNTQQIYGEDVISRIQYANSSNGLSQLHERIVGLLNDIVNDLLKQSAIRREYIYEMVCAGNTVMQHFLTKVNPKYLAEMPYIPVFRGPLWLQASEININISPFGLVYIMPHIGRYIGGDTVGVILSAELSNVKSVTLAIDIGTNGEVILATGNKLLACSTAAGPAFEGGHIENGMRAVAGAIDRVLVDEGDLRIHTVNQIPAIGICGSGIIDAVGELLNLGVIDTSGRLLGPDELDQQIPIAIRNRIRRKQTGFEILLASNQETDIILSQKDIRNVQLAKGAIAAGVDVLLNELGLVVDDISQIILAGAFGQFIRKEMAVRIGLLPNIPLNRIVFIGNGACAGAEMVLLSRKARKQAENLALQVDYIEISAKPQFQDIFTEKMLFQD